MAMTGYLTPSAINFGGPEEMLQIMKSINVQILSICTTKESCDGENILIFLAIIILLFGVILFSYEKNKGG